MTRESHNFTTGAIAALLGAELRGPEDITITSIDPIESAGPSSLTFIRSRRYAARWPSSRAAAAVVTRTVEVPGHDPSSRALLLVDNADAAMVGILEKLDDPIAQPPPGVHPSAVMDETASVSPEAAIGPMCTIGPRTEIGPGAVLHARVHIGAGVRVGAGTELHAGVTVLDRCSIGARCVLWPNVVIGADGFGYRPAPGGAGLVKIPHIGAVEIGSDVEIGAGSCIDRGKFGATTVGDGTKIDNLVQIGHNCRIGRSVIICGCTGIAGSVTIEDGVVVAGHVGVADNLRIGAGATLTAKSGVLADVPPGATVSGMPASLHRDFMRGMVALRQLSDHLRKLRKLDKLLARLDSKPS